MKFKFQWINKIVEKLPEELKEKRKAEIGSCFIGTKKQLDEKVRKSLYEQVKIISVATIIFLIVLFLTIIFYFSQDRRILIMKRAAKLQSNRFVLKQKAMMIFTPWRFIQKDIQKPRSRRHLTEEKLI